MPRQSKKKSTTKPTKRKPTPPATRMAAYRRRMRAAGLRPVQIWVPDVKSPEFIAECKAISRAIAKHDPEGEEIQKWIDENYEWPE